MPFVMQESPSREGDGLLYTYGKGIFGRLGHGIKESYTLSEKSKMLPSRVIKASYNYVCNINDITSKNIFM
jgi:hypothetical protein